MARIISIINNKGGTGKTTTVLNLGAALARRRKRVLLLDLDSQCNLTSALGQVAGEAHSGHVAAGILTPDAAILHLDKLDLLPSSPHLLDFEQQLYSEPGREFILKEQLEPLQDKYDYILVDCAPSLGLLSIGSLVAATSYIVPMQAENFAFIGLDRILKAVDKVRSRMNPAIELEGVLFVKFSPRTNFSKAVIKSLSENPLTANKLFDTYIRQDISLMECAAFKQTIYDYAPKSHGAEDYGHLAKEILSRHGKASKD